MFCNLFSQQKIGNEDILLRFTSFLHAHLFLTGCDVAFYVIRWYESEVYALTTVIEFQICVSTHLSHVARILQASVHAHALIRCSLVLFWGNSPMVWKSKRGDLGQQNTWKWLCEVCGWKKWHAVQYVADDIKIEDNFSSLMVNIH